MTTPREASASPPFPTAAAALADELCEYLAESRAEDVSVLCAFARAFLAKVPRQIASDRPLEELAALTAGAFRFLQEAGAGDVSVEVVNAEEERGSAEVTVIRARVTDRPFVVDSLREYLSAENLPIRNFIHPILEVQRDVGGRIVGLGEPGKGVAEALVHVEVGRLDDPGRREEVRAEVERRLRDVVAATDDFPWMVEALGDTVRMVEGYAATFPDRAVEFREILDFLRWLEDGNFVFLGYRAYDIVGEERPALAVERGSGLGILRQEEESTWAHSVPVAEIADHLRRRILGGPVLIVSKANAESTVHRRSRMDYIGVKKLDARGAVVGERRFLGLFTSQAYAETADAIPILRDKLRGILDGSGAPPGSHDYKEIITIFNSMPKEELFQASPSELEREVQTVLGLIFSDEVLVTLRPDPLGRGVSVMVILPRGRFSGEVRQRIQDALTRRFEGTVLNYHLAMSAGDQARLHFYVSATPDALERASREEIEQEIRQITRSWEDRLRDELIEAVGHPEAHRLLALYAPALNEEYRAANAADEAVHDVLELERIRRDGNPVSIKLFQARGREEAIAGAMELKLYLAGERLVLSDFMPVLDDAGLRVIEVAPFTVSGPELPEVMVYSFAVQNREGGAIAKERSDILSEALLAIRQGDAASDPFNALVLGAELRWRQVDVLRTYANYAFQIGAIPTRTGAARALVRYPGLARQLVELFEAKFHPAGGRRSAVGALRAAIGIELEKVTTLADDRALRRLVNLIEGTMRTNYFRHGGPDPTFRSGGVPYISLKLRCADIEDLRRSRLLYEVFVFSSRMEGIHLRAAPISRGGIRWSDRPDDFRIEILGLVQTQIVKNAVIVPSGSKGGFITKRALPERDAMMEEAAEQYRTLMRGLLDITDNLVEGVVVPPPDVVRYDGDDPYLVVAADKGTAHLSDVANGVAAEYGFWLGDAFASGGSYGYDHKKEGITARGAWECVRRHFREAGKDIQNEPFTVVGVGDMSGDVFGNGMLLSRQIRLLAAFDHRNIFIDPDPDPEISFRERARLFELPRSSWNEYDRSTLSPGAMIVPRASKEVALTEEAKAALGIDPAVDRLDGEALIRAVLSAPAELLWNGGIGTYVKDAEETHAEVGDSTNDPVRIDADELRCKVVGEGGNLGFTQRARISYALRGGRMNTDALDNSAGVDMSDHEVNLKILLGGLVASGEATLEERNALLEEMTADVNRLVLHNNVSQSLAISLDETRSREALGDFAALIASFERERVLERAADGIPSTEELQDRVAQGIGLTRPTLCVLLAYAKLTAGARLLSSTLPDDPATLKYLVDYFPEAAVRAAGARRIQQHRLRREIITTYLVNDLVDLMGSSFLHRVARDGGRPVEQVVWGWYMASELAGAAELRADLRRLEESFPAETVYRWAFGLARVLERTTRWMLNNVTPGAPPSDVIEEHLEGLARLRAGFDQVVTGEDREIFGQRMAEMEALGVERSMAARLITLRFLPELLDTVRIAREAGTDAVETARAYYLISERLGSGWLQQELRSGQHDEPWEKRLAQSLIADINRAHRAIAHQILACQARDGTIAGCLTEYEDTHAREAQVYFAIVEELRAGPGVTLAGAAVAVRALMELASA